MDRPTAAEEADSERSEGREVSLPERLHIRADVTEREAAAIAACVRAHLRREATREDTQDESPDEAGDEPADRDGFRFAGRVEALTGSRRRRPPAAPDDDWTALSRLDRF